MKANKTADQTAIMQNLDGNLHNSCTEPTIKAQALKEARYVMENTCIETAVDYLGALGRALHEKSAALYRKAAVLPELDDGYVEMVLAASEYAEAAEIVDLMKESFIRGYDSLSELA